MQTIKILVGMIVLLCAIQCPAVFMLVSGENTNRPMGGLGWDSQIPFNYNTITPIGSTNALTSGHIGANVGQTFQHGGQTYTVLGIEYNANFTLKVLRVTPKFPTNSIAELYTKRDELGKSFFHFGRGLVRGNNMVTTPAYPTNEMRITRLVCGEVNTLHITGGDIGRTFRIQWSTNAANWNSFADLHTVTSGPMCINVAKSAASMTYYRTVMNITVITNGYNAVLGDGAISWGMNEVEAIASYNAEGTNNVLYAYFDSNRLHHESVSAPGDSGGGLFINDGGKWKLAGITESGQYTCFSIGNNGNWGCGMMTDMSGIQTGYIGNNGQFVVWETFPIEGGPRPALSTFTRISSEIQWLSQFVD